MCVAYAFSIDIVTTGVTCTELPKNSSVVVCYKAVFVRFIRCYQSSTVISVTHFLVNVAKEPNMQNTAPAFHDAEYESCVSDRPLANTMSG
jgi:hypothetical protein